FLNLLKYTEFTWPILQQFVAPQVDQSTNRKALILLDYCIQHALAYSACKQTLTQTHSTVPISMAHDAKSCASCRHVLRRQRELFEEAYDSEIQITSHSGADYSWRVRLPRAVHKQRPGRRARPLGRRCG